MSAAGRPAPVRMASLMRSIRPAPAGAAQAGFAYLWVLLLVAFMGVGLVVAVEIDSTASRREREKELLAIGRQFQNAIGRYHEAPGAESPRQYPATLDDLLRDNRVPGMRRHLRKVFVDPMTAKAQWGLVTVGGRIVGVHSLSEQTPIKQANFAPEHLRLRGKKKYAEWLFVYPPELLLPAAGETTAGPDIPLPVPEAPPTKELP